MQKEKEKEYHMELKITDNNFEAEVKESSMPVLVDFLCRLVRPL